MKKIKLKTPAKINLTLDVLGTNEQGYHDLCSLVTSIDVYDYITILKRKDYNIRLKCKGIDPECSLVDNNAYKSAERFNKAFNTSGVNVTIDKRIPVGAGLGGSSADIAGVLNGMKMLYGIKESVAPIANILGSDSAYMLKGGWGVLKGRGDKQEFLELDKTLYLVILLEEKSASSKQVYREYDKREKTYLPCTDTAITALKKGDFELFAKLAKNDLYPATKALIPELQDNIKALEDAGAPLSIMTGSGSAVLGVFDNEKQRNSVYKKLKLKYKKNIIKCKTI